MRLSILLFDGFTALDVVGGYEVLANLPGMDTEFAASEAGLVVAEIAIPLGILNGNARTRTIKTEVYQNLNL